MPAVPPYIIEPIWQQVAGILPEREVDHPLGCHRPRVPDRVAIEKLVRILLFGCAYWRIADEDCSGTTLRRRRDEWIEEGAIDTLEELAREAYDGAILVSILSRWSWTQMASRSGSSAPRPIPITHRSWPRPWTRWRLASLGHYQRERA
jgi:transposase